MDDQLQDALWDAISDAQAAQKRARNPVAIERAALRAKRLHAVMGYIEQLEDKLASLQGSNAPAEGADHPFAAFTYMSDSGPVQTYYTAADDRLRVVPNLDATKCEAALRVPGLQAVVKNALERRLRLLAKGAA